MIPEGWQHFKISDLNHYVTSGSRGWAEYYSNNGSLFVRITNLTRKKLSLDLSDCKYVKLPKDSSEGKRTRLQVGDILISITADLGITAFIENELDRAAYINQHIALLRINEKGICNKFVAYQLASQSGHNQFLGLNDAGAKSGLNLDSIRRFSIAIPPLEEQRKIAEILSTWDRAIELLEQLIAMKRKLKQGLMQQLLTGKRRFKEFEGSEGFETKRLGDITHIDQKSLSNRTEPDYTFTYISLSDVDNGRILENFQRMRFVDSPSRARKLVKENDIIMATVRPNLKAFAMVKGAASEYVVSTGFAVISAKEDYFPDYIFHYLFSLHVEQQVNALVTGSNYPAINSSEVKNLYIQCPSLIEQKKIASVLSAADAEIETLEKQLSAYKQQKRGLMQQLLTGKKRVASPPSTVFDSGRPLSNFVERGENLA